MDEVRRGFEIGFRQLRSANSAATSAQQAAPAGPRDDARRGLPPAPAAHICWASPRSRQGPSRARLYLLSGPQEAVLQLVSRLLRSAVSVMHAARATALGIGALVLLGSCFEGAAAAAPAA